MKKEPPRYTDLLLIIDRELPEYSKDKSVHHFFENNTLFYINKNKLVPVNTKQLKRCIHANHPEMPEKIKNEILKGTDMETRNYFDKKFLPNISKLKLTILINSPGGGNAHLMSIIAILKYFRSKGGTIKSFSFIETSSAAAVIFSYADFRYCLKLSKFLCHIAKSPEKIEDLTVKTKEEDETEKEIEKLILEDRKIDYKKDLNKFFERHKAKHKSTIKNLIAASFSRYNCDLIMGGYNLEDWGVVNKAFYDIDEYILTIETIIGSVKLNHHRINSFLNRMKIEYRRELKKNFNYSIYLPYLHDNDDGL